MKQNHRKLYLVLVCLAVLALPLFDILQYIQYQQAQITYQIGYINWLTRPFIMPFCSLLLGWALVRFLDLQKPNHTAFTILLIILILYTILILPWCLIPIINLNLPWQTYLSILSITFTSIDFLPALFVVLGMGLAYFRK